MRDKLKSDRVDRKVLKLLEQVERMKGELWMEGVYNYEEQRQPGRNQNGLQSNVSECMDKECMDKEQLRDIVKDTYGFRNIQYMTELNLGAKN